MKSIYYILLLVVGVIILLAMFFFVNFDNKNNLALDNEITVNTSSISLTGQLTVDSVTIDSVNLLKGGFVVVREVYKEKLAQIIEVSSYLPAGNNSDVTIGLLQIPRDDTSLVAVLYEDDGDKGFNPLLDKRVIENGQTVAVYVESGEVVSGKLFDNNITEVVINADATIVYDGTQFLPKTVKIQKGDTVSFVNKSSINMWVASDPHPAHTILSSFDQFAGSEPETVYQYTFDDVGTWNYHDHINPSKIGSVVVISPPTTPPVTGFNLPALEKNTAGYFETESEIFSEIITNPEVTLVNVHVPYGGEIAGTDVFIPYNETEKLISALPEDKNAPIALYCRSGGMSAVASKDLVSAGYTNVYNLTGGMNAYKKSGREVLTK